MNDKNMYSKEVHSNNLERPKVDDASRLATLAVVAASVLSAVAAVLLSESLMLSLLVGLWVYSLMNMLTVLFISPAPQMLDTVAFSSVIAQDSRVRITQGSQVRHTLH